MINKNILWVIVLFFFSLFNSCEENNILDATGEITFSTTGLPAMQENYTYQAWLLVGGSYVSIGTFNIDVNGVNTPTGFKQINNNDLEKASGIAITIEFTGAESKSSPSDLIILAGNFSDNKAILSTSDKRTIYAKDLKAEYIVDAPTAITSEKSDKGNNGIWFSTDKNQSKETAGLVLPYVQNDSERTLSNLSYQAWIYVPDADDGTKNIPINMGAFTKANEPDNSNNYAGENKNSTPVLPGNDFVKITDINVENPVDVIDKKVIITVKPNEGNTSKTKPFPFILFEDIAKSTKGSLNMNNKNFKANFSRK